MCQEKYTKLKLDEVYILTYFLSCVPEPVHENFFNKQIQLIEEPTPMDKPSKLAEVILVAIRQKSRKNSDAIHSKQSFEIVDAVGPHISLLLIGT